MNDLSPMTPAPRAATVYWSTWTAFAAVATVLWLWVWHFAGPGPIPWDTPLFTTFIVPELVAAVVAPHYTLSRTLWTLPWPLRYGAGLWLGWLAAWTGFTWWGTLGALAGGIVFVWLSTPHLLRKRTVV